MYTYSSTLGWSLTQGGIWSDVHRLCLACNQAPPTTQFLYLCLHIFYTYNDMIKKCMKWKLRPTYPQTAERSAPAIVVVVGSDFRRKRAPMSTIPLQMASASWLHFLIILFFLHFVRDLLGFKIQFLTSRGLWLEIPLPPLCTRAPGFKACPSTFTKIGVTHLPRQYIYYVDIYIYDRGKERWFSRRSLLKTKWHF